MLSMDKLSKEEEQRAADIHKKALVIDVCFVGSAVEDPKYFEEFRKGADAGLIHTLVGGGPTGFGIGFLDALRNVDKFTEIIESTPKKMTLATTVDDIKKAKAEGKTALIFGFQDGKPVEDDLSFLRTFYKLGLRVMQLTYNTQNYIGTGCCELRYSGLTFFGQSVVEEMNKLGIAIDLTHCCDETTMDAIEYSKDPVVITHSNVRTLCNIYGRNKTNEQIKALAEKDGVIGVTLVPNFIKKQGRPTLDDLLNHIDYIVNLVGIDHVGFGGDLNRKYIDQGTVPPTSSRVHWARLRPDIFTGPVDRYPPRPLGLERHTELPNLTKGLVARGYSDQEIIKILGGNFLRVFKNIWGK